MNIRPVEVIRHPVIPNADVVRDDDLIESFEFGSRPLKGTANKSAPYITIEIAQHTDGMWMWSTSCFWKGRYSGYRVGPKWGNFTYSREDAITAAVREVFGRNRQLPPGADAWLLDLCGASQKQMELF